MAKRYAEIGPLEPTVNHTSPNKTIHMAKALIFSPAVKKLSILIEEGARATASGTTRFIEPTDGALLRAISRRHHIVFGRRGSGKSSLLHKSAENLRSDANCVAYVDLEPYKGHQYPDVLLSVLLDCLVKFKTGLKATHIPSPLPLWLFCGAEKRARAATAKTLIKNLEDTIKELKAQLHSTDGAHLSRQVSHSKAHKTNDSASCKIPAGELSATISDATEESLSKNLTEQYIRSKQDWLHRKIIDFHEIFVGIREATGKDSFLFLDDLYHIHKKDQASLIDYFHRIAKGHNLWLKIGTIKNRSKWYIHNPQPTGLKLGDDADEIDLDLTLEKFSASKQFLNNILETYIKEARSPGLNEIMADGGFDRLVLASGGVTRDFLGLFRRSIEETKERLLRTPKHMRGEKIGAEDINLAAGGYGETKKEEFKRDTLEDRQNLEQAFSKLRLFCVEKSKCNVFLIDQELQDANSNLVQELIDLRLIHHVRSRVTVSDRPGMVYRALLLDVSQYTGERTRRDVQMVEFWKENQKDALRKISLIYNPNVTEEQLLLEIEKIQKEKSPQNTKQQGGEQLGLDV